MQFLSLSLLVPIAYLGILVGSLATFSHLYRQRKLNAKLRLAPYFPRHIPRDAYLSLLHLPDTDPSNNNIKVPDSVLRAALLNRAVEDIYRIMEVRTRKGPLNQLLQRGVVGDEMWQRILRAEQELEVELKDVVEEANALAPGWGQVIFQSASEMAQNRRLKEQIAKIQGTVAKEQVAWDKQREKSRLELEGEDTESTRQKAAVVDVPVAVEQKTAKSASSDDDGVIVETPGIDATSTEASEVTGGGSGGGGGKNKKKKGKK